MNLAKIDKQMEGNCDVEGTYRELNEYFECQISSREDSELLWRMAKSCHTMAANSVDKNMKKKYLLEGRVHAQKAAHLNPSNFFSLKYAAVVTGAAVEHIPITQKVEQGKLFKDYLDAALSLDPSEVSLLHMRGRYSYSVSQMSWIERKAVNAFFSNPPQATIEDAIVDLEAANEIRPDWIDNLLFLGKSYLVLGNKKSAGKHLRKCCEFEPIDDTTALHLREAKELLRKCE